MSWKRAVQYKQEQPEESDLPPGERLPLTNQYASNDPALNEVRFGDGIWIFTVPEFTHDGMRRRLPPTILGRLTVTHRRHSSEPEMQPAPGAPNGFPKTLEGFSENGDYYVVSMHYPLWLGGAPGVALPIHNAFNVFRKLRDEVAFRDPVAHQQAEQVEEEISTQGPFGEVLGSFQGLRKLTDAGKARLSRLQEHVSARRTVFLSYRRKEARDVVREVAEHLADDALCWWDEEALPQAGWIEQGPMLHMLRDGIRQAGWFVSFLTDEYGRAPASDQDMAWTMREWREFAQRQGEKPDAYSSVQVLLTDSARERATLKFGAPSTAIIDVGADPIRIAKQIVERLRSRQ